MINDDNDEMLKVINCGMYMLNFVAQITDYSWDDEFCRKEIKEEMNKIRERLKEVDFKKLSLRELQIIRFGKWTENFLLCPLYLQPILKPGCDNDIRYGCIADGWKIENGKVCWDKESDILEEEKDVKND